MKYCAILNAENICTGVSQIKADAKVENGIVLEKFDISVLGKKYNDGVWENGPEEDSETSEESDPEILEDPQPTQLDNIEATQLTIMTAMAEQYEESLERELTNMEVQATIYEAILEMGGAE